MTNSYLNNLYTKTVVACPKKCTGGYILKGDSFEACSCMIEFQKIAKYYTSGIPKKYYDFNLRNLTVSFKKDNELPLKIISTYVDNIAYNISRSNGLYFQSDPGLGKTALSCWVLMQAINNNLNAYFIKYSDLIKLFFDELSQLQDEKLDSIRKADIVCIDRIDRGYATDNSYAFKRVDEIFSHFYDNGTAIIVTSNVARDSCDFPFGSLLDELVDIIFTGTPYRNNLKTLRDIMK